MRGTPHSHVRQSYSQCFVGPKQQRFHRRLRTTDHTRDLRVLHLFVLVHHHRGPLLGRQAVNRLPHLPQLRLVQQLLFYRPAPVRHLPARAVRRLLIQTGLRLLVAPVADPVERQMRRDAEQPGGKFRAGLDNFPSIYKRAGTLPASVLPPPRRSAPCGAENESWVPDAFPGATQSFPGPRLAPATSTRQSRSRVC